MAKPVATYQKLRGGYYTPQPIADFLARWAIQSPTAKVLEPSCGDGNLLVAAAKTLIERGASKRTLAGLIHGVEIDPPEVLKATERLRALGVSSSAAPVQTGDFFAYCQASLSGQKLFDAVIGNPPFIRYQNFLEEHRSTAFYLMRRAGLHPNRLTNSWVPFLVAGTLLLNEGGRLAMVIPAELLQVNYAAELRLFLSNYYNKITLVTFKKLLFDGIQQEVVLLLGERNGGDRTGIRTIELESSDDLAAYEHADFSAGELKPMDHSTEKWTQYFLAEEEILLLRALRDNSDLTIARDVIDVDVGIVTGLNEFFVLSRQQVEDRLLEPHTRRIVSRSGHLPGIIFSAAHWRDNAEKQLPCFLLTSPDVPFDSLPRPIKDYVIDGEEEGHNKGYKCRIRKRWYVVPSMWVPQAFMLRQIHDYPKLVLNRADATCTDTIHRVRLRQGIRGETIAGAFLNSLTFAFAEVIGRSYGGGVLELEPNEAERLPIPLTKADTIELNQLNQLLLARDVSAVLDITDRVLLIDGLGLTLKEAKLVRGIWEKLRDRRIHRKHKKAPPLWQPTTSVEAGQSNGVSRL